MVKRRWLLRAGIALAAAVALLYAAGGWYFSGEIRSGGLEPAAPERDFGATAVRIDGASIVLEGTGAADRGEHGLYWADGFGFVGDVEAATDEGVRRPFTAAVGSPPPRAPGEIDVDSWYYPADPADAGLTFTEVRYGSPVGAMRAWHVAAGELPAATWAIHVHGWRGDRREALRALPAFHTAGIDSLVIEYRNDPGAPPDPTGLYRFGRSEWQDVAGAVRYALDQGADRIVLVGYSTGAAAAFAFLERSDLAGVVVGLVFDSPNLDFGRIVKQEGRDTRLVPGLPFTVPDSLAAVAMFIADLRYDVGWDDIDYLGHDYALTIPALVFHGDADDTVPLAVSEDLAAAHPDRAELVVTRGADHVQSWNVDRARYERVLGGFLAGL